MTPPQAEYPKVTFRLPADLLMSLQTIATHEGSSLSKTIKQALIKFVRQYQINSVESDLCHALTAPSQEDHN